MNSLSLLYLLLLSTAAGLSLYIGGVFAAYSHRSGHHLSPLMHHGMLSFGGGALLSAVGLVLVPDGLEILSVGLAAGLFALGGLVFMGVDRVLAKNDTPLSAVVAALLDFIPECIVIGAIIATDIKMAIVVTIIIAAQNIPEGYGAFCEFRTRKNNSNSKDLGWLSCHPLYVLAACVLVGPLAALFGYYVCDKTDPLLGGIMLFCAGGILFIVFRDIAPKADLEKSGVPSLGAVAGFSVGLIGLGLVH